MLKRHTVCPSSLRRSMRTSLRRFASDSLGEPLSSTCAALAQLTKSWSCVRPRSSVMGSYLVRPSPLRITGSPPDLYSTTSDDRFSAPTLLTIATGEVEVPKYTRKRQLLYGSKRFTLTVKGFPIRLAL